MLLQGLRMGETQGQKQNILVPREFLSRDKTEHFPIGESVTFVVEYDFN